MATVRAVRGATTAHADNRDEILAATRELLSGMLEANKIGADDIVCAFFSGTPDITAAFPAAAGRELGWDRVPLFGSQELSISGAPARCIRVMLLVDGASHGPENHVYLREAAGLRPDLARPSQGQTGGAESAGLPQPSLFSLASTYKYYSHR